ncbi:MAG: hypothetical protein NTY68_01235 [Candidatus Micrarchaeota archaeon]|nr:hypothetical protein [Candidatus Micrarchaeota archaeon]
MKMIIAVLAMLVLFFGCVDNVIYGSNDNKANATGVFNKSINGYVSLMRNTGAYSAVFYNEINGKSSGVSVAKNNEDYQVLLSSDMYSWTLKNVKGTQYLCLEFNGRKECSSNITATTAPIANNLATAVFSSQYEDMTEIKYNSLMKHNSINMISFNESEDSYIFDINYSLKDLTGEELSRIFLSPTSSAMAINNFREKMVFRKSDYLRTNDELIYNYLGSSNDEISGIRNFSYGKQEISAPANVSEDKFNVLLSDFNDFWTRYTSAKTDDDYKQIAIEFKMPQFCKKTSKVLECIDAYTAMTKDARGCDYLNATEKDTCYYNFGTIDSKKYCDSVVNETMRQDCISKSNSASNQTAAKNQTANNSVTNGTITNETVKNYIVYS